MPEELTRCELGLECRSASAKRVRAHAGHGKSLAVGKSQEPVTREKQVQDEAGYIQQCGWLSEKCRVKSQVKSMCPEVGSISVNL